MQVQYEPSSVTLQTRLSPASFADLIWMQNEHQVQRHQAPEEFYQHQLRKTGRSNGRMASALTHDSRRVCGQWRRNEFERGGRAPNLFGHAPTLFWPKSTISDFAECFRDGQYSLASFLFAVLLLTVPPCPMESAILFEAMLWVAVIRH